MAQDLERDPPALLGQLHALVRRMRDELERAQLLHHARRRGGRDAEAGGKRVRRDPAVATLLERVDRLGVVLDRLTQPTPLAAGLSARLRAAALPWGRAARLRMLRLG